MSMYRIVFFLLVLFVSERSCAQSLDDVKLIYTNQFNAGGQISTNGWGINGTHGKYDGFYNVKLRSLEIVKIKHPKEIKLAGSRDNSRRWTYGKLNSLQTVRLMLGRKKILTDKLRHGAVALGFTYHLGLNLGVLKPTFVEIRSSTGSASRVVRYDPDEHTFDEITGRANFLHGLDKLKFQPGGVFKFSFFFEYSGDNESIQQVEIGAAADVFGGDVPIMIEEATNRFIFPSIFLNYTLGKKYIKR